jgi:hypothetical protein
VRHDAALQRLARGVARRAGALTNICFGVALNAPESCVDSSLTRGIARVWPCQGGQKTLNLLVVAQAIPNLGSTTQMRGIPER